MIQPLMKAHTSFMRVSDANDRIEACHRYRNTLHSLWKHADGEDHELRTPPANKIAATSVT